MLLSTGTASTADRKPSYSLLYLSLLGPHSFVRYLIIEHECFQKETILSWLLAD